MSYESNEFSGTGINSTRECSYLGLVIRPKNKMLPVSM
jgi:hypothetical protein